MFGKRRETPLKQWECFFCHHLFGDKAAGGTVSFTTTGKVEERWYCKDHLPAYSRFERSWDGEALYFKEFLVSPTGEPFGFVPAEWKTKAERQRHAIANAANVYQDPSYMKSHQKWHLVLSNNEACDMKLELYPDLIEKIISMLKGARPPKEKKIKAEKVQH